MFEVILSICSEFFQIETPHFSLEGAFYAKLQPVTTISYNNQLEIIKIVSN